MAVISTKCGYIENGKDKQYSKNCIKSQTANTQKC